MWNQPQAQQNSQKWPNIGVKKIIEIAQLRKYQSIIINMRCHFLTFFKFEIKELKQRETKNIF